jgi:hypothetical protein
VGMWLAGHAAQISLDLALCLHVVSRCPSMTPEDEHPCNAQRITSCDLRCRQSLSCVKDFGRASTDCQPCDILALGCSSSPAVAQLQLSKSRRSLLLVLPAAQSSITCMDPSPRPLRKFAGLTSRRYTLWLHM